MVIKEPSFGSTPNSQNKVSEKEAALDSIPESNFEVLAKMLLGDEVNFADYQEQIPQLLQALFEVFEKHGGRVREVSANNFGNVFLQSIKNYPIVLRKENPVALVGAFAQNMSINLRPGTHANACLVAERNQFNDNLRTVLTEGFGMVDKLGMVGIVAYDGLSTVQIKHPEVVEHTQYKTNTKRDGDRTVSGAFNSKDIRAILLRVPMSKYPENLMTEDELEKLDDLKSWEEEIEALIAQRDDLKKQKSADAFANMSVAHEIGDLSSQIDKLKKQIGDNRVYRVVEFSK